jgi:hypothetical protein
MSAPSHGWAEQKKTEKPEGRTTIWLAKIEGGLSAWL